MSDLCYLGKTRMLSGTSLTDVELDFYSINDPYHIRLSLKKPNVIRAVEFTSQTNPKPQCFRIKF